MSFQDLFITSKGQPITYKGKVLQMIDRVNLSSGRVGIKVSFLQTNSKWKQGIVLQTKGKFEVNGKIVKSNIVLWEHTAPPEIGLFVMSDEAVLIVYNSWQTEDGTIHYWHNGAAMRIDEKEQTRIYNCNDGNADEDFDDLIFQIEFL